MAHSGIKQNILAQQGKRCLPFKIIFKHHKSLTIRVFLDLHKVQNWVILFCAPQTFSYLHFLHFTFIYFLMNNMKSTESIVFNTIYLYSMWEVLCIKMDQNLFTSPTRFPADLSCMVTNHHAICQIRLLKTAIVLLIFW